MTNHISTKFFVKSSFETEYELIQLISPENLFFQSFQPEKLLRRLRDKFLKTIPVSKQVEIFKIKFQEGLSPNSNRVCGSKKDIGAEIVY